MLQGVLATAVAVAGLVALPLAPATAVSTGRPVAVAVAADGTSYAGFATGGRLLRLTPAGRVDGSVALDRSDPVTALDVGPGGSIWVDYGTSVSELGPDGTLLTHFSHQPGAACPADRAHDPARYGGLDVTDDAVYVAGRCRADLEVYDRAGTLEARVDLPGTAYPRGVSWAPAVKGVPARVYVAVPASGKVYGYDAENLGDRDPKPARTITLQRRDGFDDPEPGGVVADARGQVVVVDVANNAVYFYDGPDGYRFYRTLGHPPDPATDKGHLDRPTAIAQAGAALDRQLWVADSGNGRIQRWSTDGTTQWMTDALPPTDPGAPDNVDLPEISGRPFQGLPLTCGDGTWTGAPTGFTRVWQRDGVAIDGATGPTYVVSAADVGADLTCVVTATNDSGSGAPASSAAYPIPGPTSPPYVIDRPLVTGDAASGSVLTCGDGTWTGAPATSYLRSWLRDDRVLPGTNARQYLLTRDDVAHEISCRVAAVNQHGTGAWASSDPTPVAEGGDPHVDAPENTRRPAVLGTAAVGQTLICQPGEWTDAPTFTYAWERDGRPVGGSGADHYAVGAADKGRSLVCVVTGANPAGSGTARSTAVVPTAGPLGPGDPGDPDDPGTDGSTKTCRGSARVSIDGGKAYAGDRYVVLTIRVPLGATAVTISNDAGFRHADTRALAGSCRYRWTLPASSSRRPKVVHVRFPGASRTHAVTDTIVLDSSAPRLRSIDARWRTSWWSWVLTIHASDRGTGLWKVQVGASKGSTRWVRWGKPVNDQDSSKLRWVRVWDRAGNPSGWYHLTGF